MMLTPDYRGVIFYLALLNPKKRLVIYLVPNTIALDIDNVF